MREIQQDLDRLMDGNMKYEEQRATLRGQMARIDSDIEKLRKAKRFIKSQMKRIDSHEVRKLGLEPNN